MTVNLTPGGDYVGILDSSWQQSEEIEYVYEKTYTRPVTWRMVKNEWWNANVIKHVGTTGYVDLKGWLPGTELDNDWISSDTVMLAQFDGVITVTIDPKGGYLDGDGPEGWTEDTDGTYWSNYLLTPGVRNTDIYDEWDGYVFNYETPGGIIIHSSDFDRPDDQTPILEDTVFNVVYPENIDVTFTTDDPAKGIVTQDLVKVYQGSTYESSTSKVFFNGSDVAICEAKSTGAGPDPAHVWAFDYWNVVPGDSKAGVITVPTNFEANWKSVDRMFTVKFDTNGGTPAVGDQVVRYGDKATDPSDQTFIPGQEIEGWYIVDAEGDMTNVKWNFSQPVTTDLELRAKWVDAEYTITYVGWSEHCASKNPNVPSYNYTDEGAPFELTDPTPKAGWRFVGWTGGTTGGQVVTEPTKGEEFDTSGWFGDALLVCHWEKVQTRLYINLADKDMSEYGEVVWMPSVQYETDEDGLNYIEVDYNSYFKVDKGASQGKYYIYVGTDESHYDKVAYAVAKTTAAFTGQFTGWTIDPDVGS